MLKHNSVTFSALFFSFPPTLQNSLQDKMSVNGEGEQIAEMERESDSEKDITYSST